MNRAELLAHSMIRTAQVETPAGTIAVRGLTASDSLDMARVFGNTYGELVYLIYGVLDEKGERLFTKDDVEVIGNMPLMVVSPILKAIKELSGLDDATPKATAASS